MTNLRSIALATTAVIGLASPAHASSGAYQPVPTLADINKLCDTDKKCEGVAHVAVAGAVIGGVTTFANYDWQASGVTCVSGDTYTYSPLTGHWCRMPVGAPSLTGVVLPATLPPVTYVIATVADLVNTSGKTYLTPASYPDVYLLGYYSANDDGGSALKYYSSSCPWTVDNGMAFATSVAGSCYARPAPASADAMMAWWGVSTTFTTGTANPPRAQAATTWANTYSPNARLHFGPGTYKFSSGVVSNGGAWTCPSFVGAGKNATTISVDVDPEVRVFEYDGGSGKPCGDGGVFDLHVTGTAHTIPVYVKDQVGVRGNFSVGTVRNAVYLEDALGSAEHNQFVVDVEELCNVSFSVIQYDSVAGTNHSFKNSGLTGGVISTSACANPQPIIYQGPSSQAYDVPFSVSVNQQGGVSHVVLSQNDSANMLNTYGNLNLEMTNSGSDLTLSGGTGTTVFSSCCITKSIKGHIIYGGSMFGDQTGAMGSNTSMGRGYKFYSEDAPSLMPHLTAGTNQLTTLVEPWLPNANRRISLRIGKSSDYSSYGWAGEILVTNNGFGSGSSSPGCYPHAVGDTFGSYTDPVFTTNSSCGLVIQVPNTIAAGAIELHWAEYVAAEGEN